MVAERKEFIILLEASIIKLFVPDTINFSSKTIIPEFLRVVPSVQITALSSKNLRIYKNPCKIIHSNKITFSEMTFHLIKIGPKNSLIQSAIRYSSKTSLQVQREQWRASQLTRVEKVEKQLQQRRVQVRGPDERTSFIRHKLFGQYEQGRFPFYHYAQTHS